MNTWELKIHGVEMCACWVDIQPHCFDVQQPDTVQPLGRVSRLPQVAEAPRWHACGCPATTANSREALLLSAPIWGKIPSIWDEISAVVLFLGREAILAIPLFPCSTLYSRETQEKGENVATTIGKNRYFGSIPDMFSSTQQPFFYLLKPSEGSSNTMKMRKV